MFNTAKCLLTSGLVDFGPSQKAALISDLPLLFIQQFHELLQHRRLRFILGRDEVIQLRIEHRNGILLGADSGFQVGQLLQCLCVSHGRCLRPIERIKLKFVILRQNYLS